MQPLSLSLLLYHEVYYNRKFEEGKIGTKCFHFLMDFPMRMEIPYSFPIELKSAVTGMHAVLLKSSSCWSPVSENFSLQSNKKKINS